jgi:protein gp37
MQAAWAESLRDQCQASGVPFFFKKFANGDTKLI